MKFQNPIPEHRFKIHTANGHKFVKINDIIYCRAEGNYTEFILEGNSKPVIACGNLKCHEQQLHEFDMLRIHKSYIVNKAHVTEYIRDKSGDTGGKIIMSNGESVPLSKSHKSEFLE